MTPARTRPVIVTLTWLGVDEPTLEAVASGLVGLQGRGSALTPPSVTDGSRLEFTVEVGVAGDAPPHDLRGPHVQGRAGERFLYLSFAEADGSGWRRRLKIMVPPDLDASGPSLTVAVRDPGGSRAEILHGWTAP